LLHRFSKNPQILNLMKIHPAGVVPCRRKDITSQRLLFTIFRLCLAKGAFNHNTTSKVSYLIHISFFFFSWHYSPWWTAASSRIVLHRSRSCNLRLQFLMPTFLRSSSTYSGHFNLGFPTH